ncbi:uncharacterized protein [Littorina saxatilis]|uniref:uncharacterized protein n=1 Tax=Littorina saxatilis TaxID=31220 RepID=UPI0038B465A9
MSHLYFVMTLVFFVLGTESCKFRETLFSRKPDLSDLVFADSLLFQFSAVSAEDCAHTCAATPSCSSFTYPAPMHTRGTCRGHATRELSGNDATPSAGTVAFLGRKVIPTNVAIHKPARQSSVYYGSTALAANDGSFGNTHHFGQCIHTWWASGVRSWWQVDLEASYDICSVTITSRKRCCEPRRLHDFDVDVYDKDPVTYPEASVTRCHHHVGHMPRDVTEELVCDDPPITGRVVRVTNAPEEPLSLCEVQVLAVP